MAAIIFSALVMCAVSLFIGQAALRLAGAQEWNWLAPAVGLSIAMLLATPTVHIPGRSATMAVLLAALTIAAAVWCLRSPQHRPPLPDLAAALPAAFLVLVPFLAAGRGGILGVTVNNDMTVHLAIVESFLSPAAAEFFPLPSDYPLGPHALAAALSKGLGIEPDLAFSGWTMAIPIISALTALAAARHASWLGKAIAATVVGIPFLVAAYYGQGAFKEVAQSALVLALAISLSGYGPRLGRGRWVPVALLSGGVVSVYSLPGLQWVVAIVGLWLAGQVAIYVWRGQVSELPRIVRRELPALGIGIAVLAGVLLTQAQRMWEFLNLLDSTGIADDNIGNLVGPLPGWEALGVWDSPDFRLPASAAYMGGKWSWFVIALIIFGSYWAVRRGRWLLPLSAAGAMLIWKVSDVSQSPYVAAKALVIASPLLLLVAALPLLDREGTARRRPGWPWLLVPLLGLVLLLRVGSSDLRTLRFSPVGPTNHARQLASLHPYIAGKTTLVFGEDEFLLWELAGAKSRATALGPTPQVALRESKGWEFGQPFDFDTVPASTLNEYEWVITPRDAAMSAPPPQLRLVHSTEAFELWKRVGQVRERSVLDEGQWPGVTLDCDSQEGRRILAAGGVAAVRRQPIVATGAAALAGGTIRVPLNLPPGRWQLSAPYTSPYPVHVTAPGLHTELAPTLDRLGPRWPIGRIAVPRRRSMTISFHIGDTALTSPMTAANFAYVIATPLPDVDRIVPIQQACGRYVDWYRSAPS